MRRSWGGGASGPSNRGRWRRGRWRPCSRRGCTRPAAGSQLVTLVAVQDPAVRARLSAINAAILGTDNDPYYGAPTIVVVLSSPERPTWVEDGSCALTVMMEAAHALGLGSCWIHRARQMFDSPEGKALLQAWGVPEDMRGVGALSLGYPAGAAPKAPARKPGRVFRV